MKRNHLLMTITLFWLFGIGLLTLCGCTGENSATEKKTTVLPQGNSDANLNNLGLAATDGDSLYYINSDKGYDIIYKAAADDRADEAILGLSGYIQFLNISDGFFYFVGVTYDSDGKAGASVFRASLDGEERKWLFDIDESLDVNYMRVVDDTVFYVASASEDKSALYAVNIESGAQTALIAEDDAIQSVNLAENGIYYVDGTEICRAKPDGSEKEALYTGNIWVGNMILNGDKLYFTETQKDRTDNICVLNNDGGEPETLLTGINWVNYLNIEGQTLYYADHTYDGEGNLKSAAFYGLDTVSGETAAVGETNGSYVGFSIIDGNLIYQEEDNGALTAKVIPLAASESKKK